MRLGWRRVQHPGDCDQLLAAVPEPETYAMLSACLGLPGFMLHAARVFK